MAINELHCQVDPQGQRGDVHQPHRGHHHQHHPGRNHDGAAVTPRCVAGQRSPQGNAEDPAGGERRQGPRQPLDDRLGEQTGHRLVVCGHSHRQLRHQKRDGGTRVENGRTEGADGEPVERPAAGTVRHPHHHGGDHHQKRLADRDGHPGDQDVPDIGLRSQCGAVGMGDDRADEARRTPLPMRGRRRWPPRCRAAEGRSRAHTAKNRMGKPNAMVAIIGACHRSTAKPASAAARTISPAPKRLRERGGSCGNSDVVSRGVSTRCAGAAAYAPRRSVRCGRRTAARHRPRRTFRRWCRCRTPGSVQSARLIRCRTSRPRRWPAPSARRGDRGRGCRRWGFPVRSPCRTRVKECQRRCCPR